MGLFMDANGIPITYDLYAGNTNDCLTYRPTFSRMKKEFDLGKVIVVADKGMSTGDNIQYTLSANDGFVFSQTARGANKALKDYILSDEGYTYMGDDYKWKERVYPTEIWVTMTSGKKKKKTIDAKQVVFYSEKVTKSDLETRPVYVSTEDQIKAHFLTCFIALVPTWTRTTTYSIIMMRY